MSNSPPRIIPGYRFLKIGETIQEGDLVPVYYGEGSSSWTSIWNSMLGRQVESTDLVIRIGEEPKISVREESKIPHGWTLVAESDRIREGDQLFDRICPRGSFFPVVKSTIGSVVGSSVDLKVFYVIRMTTRLASNSSPVKEEKKEKTKMATPNNIHSTSLPGFFETLKASAATATKTAASTTLAEKITELVLNRLPGRIQVLAKAVPKPVLVFAISMAVYAAACRFEIPGREKVRDVSKYALDGSMFEAMRLLTRLLDPIFAAIKDLVPTDLAQLINEAEKS